jgi:hypothetical protein
MAPKSIFKTWITVIDDEMAQHAVADTIVYEGKLWLVPEWIDNRVAGWTMPARIIALDGLPYESLPAPHECDYLLHEGIPKGIYCGQIRPEPDSCYVVIETPNIRLPGPGHYPYKPSP